MAIYDAPITDSLIHEMYHRIHDWSRKNHKLRGAVKEAPGIDVKSIALEVFSKTISGQRTFNESFFWHGLRWRVLDEIRRETGRNKHFKPPRAGKEVVIYESLSYKLRKSMVHPSTDEAYDLLFVTDAAGRVLSAEAECLQTLTFEAIDEAIELLPLRERYVIEQYYFCDRKLLSISKDFGFSEARICQIKKKAERTIASRIGVH
jgi:RNA polymerase sigma factor (sigma-70 family)